MYAHIAHPPIHRPLIAVSHFVGSFRKIGKMGYDTIRTTQTGGVVRAVFVANEINLITWKFMLDCNELLDKLANDESVKVVVFESGVKDFFFAHMDLTPDPGQLFESSVNRNSSRTIN